MILDHDIDVSAVRQWCVSVGINATINPTIYRGRIRHYEATMSPDDMFLFRFRWDEKTRTVCDNDAGPVGSNNVVPFNRPCARPS
ncbi:hypothetical protein C8J25_101833 [Sphingomonas faeni]|uniref:Uncharacterized protein n=2 Tax=Sphingomonas faeni TaxID=185950 RepID=A0A2T5UCT1_9SPHN|nr:hypothetical protein C8J25_101833 [Sphingomonas faeni]